MKLIGTRREFLRASAAAGGSSLLLSGCLHGAATKSEPASGDEAAAKNKESSEMGGEVTATEDLMREHGVLRRALLIYTATATKLREDHVAFPAEPLRKTATLFRDFGEEYHEKKLEEFADVNSWSRGEYIEKGGWDKMPGQEKAGSEVARACAEGLDLLVKK